MTGERYGPYELVQYLTAGGMADLYLARAAGSDQLLVIKRIQARYVEHTRVVKMFIDEGRIAQVLAHPNVVKVVDVGDVDGSYYIAMEYIPGHDLIAIARRGVETGLFLPRPLAVGVVSQVATGLAYAHSRRDRAGRSLELVHCDISPGNVVVSAHGTAKIVDFGIARATIALREEDGVAGKYNYMAPEQIKGGRVDARSDLFSLGVILYELCVGKRLFRGRPEVIIRKVCEEDLPRPSAVRRGFPTALEAIIMRLLEREPERRYQTAAQLRIDLRSYLHESGLEYSKRAVAEYLRDLFRAPRERADDEDFSPEYEEEELELERAIPGAEAPLEVDPEDDDDELRDALRERPALFDAPTERVDALSLTRDPRWPRPAEPAGGTNLPVDEEGIHLPIEVDEGDLAKVPMREVGEPPVAGVRRRARPAAGLLGRRYSSTGIIFGTCMIAFAVLLLIAYFLIGR